MSSDRHPPSIALLEPCSLDGFVPAGPRHAQPASVPAPFLDAFDVRDVVFIQEQKVPLQNEFDADDCRSCHWVVYSSAAPDPAAVPEGSDDALKPSHSPARKQPVGTVRLVPFPHDPHPEVGGDYWNGVLQGQREQPALDGQPDRSTSFHDGREPYMKLGRLAVVKECRGQGLASLLVNAALAWLRANPSYFDGAAATGNDVARWKGLVCVHAQEQAVGTWARLGFHVDEGMGRWFEEGIPHLGMFQRLNIEPLP